MIAARYRDTCNTLDGGALDTIVEAIGVGGRLHWRLGYSNWHDSPLLVPESARAATAARWARMLVIGAMPVPLHGLQFRPHRGEWRGFTEAGASVVAEEDELQLTLGMAKEQWATLLGEMRDGVWPKPTISHSTQSASLAQSLAKRR